MIETLKEYAKGGDVPLTMSLGAAVAGLTGYGLKQSVYLWVICGAAAAGAYAVRRAREFDAYRFIPPFWRLFGCYAFGVVVFIWVLLAIIR